MSGAGSNRVRIDSGFRGWSKSRLPALARRRAHQFLKALALQRTELSILLVGDAQIRALNKAWRQKDKATDVLSFPQGGKLLGDIVISIDTARRQAREWNRTVEEEVERYLAHGLLHLLGHDHHREADSKRMAKAEAKLLGRSGMLQR